MNEHEHEQDERWGMKRREKNGLSMTDLFCGAGVGASGFLLAGYDIAYAIDNQAYAVDTYNQNIGNHAVLGDIRKLNSDTIPDSDVITGGFPCFHKGTLITTDRGLVEIENVTLEDKVLTHTNQFKSVLRTMKQKKKGIYHLKVQGSPQTFATEEHPYYVREMKRVWNNKKRGYERKFSEPKWKDLKDLVKDDFIGFSTNTNAVNALDLSREELWLLGRYVADGYIQNGKRAGRKNSYNHKVIFCVGKAKIDEFEKHVETYYLGKTEERTVYKCRIINERFMNIALQFGKGAINKEIPQFIMDLPKDLLHIFLEGYISGDGYFDKRYQKYSITTISRKLAYQMGQIVQKIFEVPYSMEFRKARDEVFIEGRKVTERDCYKVSFATEVRKQNNAVFIDGMLWCPFKSIEYKESFDDFVYNLEVEVDNSYVANNCTVHNCTPFSVAGKGDGVNDKEKGDLGYHFYRIIKEKQPKAFLMENVAGLLTKKHKGFFEELIQLFEEAGYNVSWDLVNTWVHGVPQLRKRVFAVGIRKDLKKIFVFPEAIPEHERTTIRDAIGDLPDPDGLNNHTGYGIRKDEAPFIDKVQPGGNWRDIPEEDQKTFLGKAFYSGGGRTGFLRKVKFDRPAWTLTSCMNGKNNAQIVDNKDKYSVLPVPNQNDYYKGDYSPRYKSRNRQKQWDEPSFTIVSQARQLPLHPEPPHYDIREMDTNEFPPPRRFTVRECLRLQTVPDWFYFSKEISLAKQYERCSGIPSLMAYKLGIEIEKVIGKEE